MPSWTARIARLLAVTLLATVVGSCGEEAPPLPTLEGQWFWRDVLAEPLGDEAAPRLELLATETPAEAVAALADLLLADDPATLTTAMAALRDEREGVAIAAAEVLGRLGDRAAIPRLLKGLGPYPVDYDASIAVRAAQASALARLGNPAGIPLLLSLLAEDTAHERPRGQLQFTRSTRMVLLRELSLPGLEALAGEDFGYEPNGSVPRREQALAAMQSWWDTQRETLWAAAPVDGAGLRLRARLLVANLDSYQLRQIDGSRYTLEHLGPGVLPHLEEGLAAPDDYQRLHVLEVMERLADQVDRKTRGRIAVIAAVPLLEDPSSAVAAQAARTCGAVGVADPLVEALDRRRESDVRLAMVDALGASGRRDALASLEAWLAGRDALGPDLRAAVAAARLRLSDDGDPGALLELLGSDDPDQAYPAIERLVQLTGSDHGLDPLADAETRASSLAAAERALANL